MKAKAAFDDSLNLTKITLLFSGIKIYQNKWNLIVEYFIISLFYLNFIWLYMDVFGEFNWLIEGIQVGKSFGELSMIAPCTTICFLATAKSTPLYFNRHLLVKVIMKLREIHPDIDIDVEDKGDEVISTDDNTINENKSEKIERIIVKESMSFLNVVIHLLYYSSSVVVIVFTLLPLIVMGYEYYKEGETELQLPFLVKYFFNPFTKSMWPLVYIHQVWSTFIAAFNVFGADTFIYAFCAYTQMHFRILCHRYENVVSQSLDETRRQLGQLVERHQLLISLVNDMEIMCSKSILFNIVTSSVLICLSGFNVTFLDDIGAVVAFLTFLVMSISQISLLCLFGDMLMRSSVEVSRAVYKSRWYDLDNDTKKSIFLILIRAQKPCKLTAAKFADLNLSAFTTILSRSWSYFALLKTMYK